MFCSGIELDRNGGVRSARDLQACTEQIREMVLSRLNHAVAGKLVSSVDILRDSYTGWLVLYFFCIPFARFIFKKIFILIVGHKFCL